MQHARGVIAGWLLVAVTACDSRQVFHVPEPGLERMLVQPRGAPYEASSAFSDGRLMRMPVADTVPVEQPWSGQPSIETGRDDTGYLADVPFPSTGAFMRNGRIAFERVCATCHGLLGDGESIVAQKMEVRKPPSLHEPRIARLPAGQVFEIVSRGYGLMPGYAALLNVQDRWAVVAYLSALRLSQAAPVASLPEAVQVELKREAP